MKQYCRYCAFCIDNGYNELYCNAYYPKDKRISYNYAKSANHCKEYGYCGIDVFTGLDHKEKIPYTRKAKTYDGEQITLKVGENNV